MKIQDYTNLINLWKKSGLPHKPIGRDSKQSIAEQLKMDNCFFILAEKEEKIIASIVITHDGRKGWINRLAVDPDYRNRGIALRLIKEGEEILKKAGIAIFAALIEEWNENSVKLFEKANYKNFEGIRYYTKRLFPEI